MESDWAGLGLLSLDLTYFRTLVSLFRSLFNLCPWVPCLLSGVIRFLPFYTLYLFPFDLLSSTFDWQIAIISSRMVVPTLRHRIAIRLARGMQLSSAEQADVSTCSGVVRLLLLSLPPRKPSGIGLLWVVGRKFLCFFFPLCALRSTYVSSRSLAIQWLWLIREIFGTLYLACFGRFDVFDDVFSLSNPIYWFLLMENLLTTFWVSLGAFGYPRCCAVPSGFLADCLFFFLSSGNLWGEPDWCMGIRLCCFCDFIIFWVGFGIWNRWLIFVDGIVMLLMVHLVLCLLVWTSAVLWRTNFVPLLASKMVMVSLERNLLGEWYSIAFIHSCGWELTSKLFSTWRL